MGWDFEDLSALPGSTLARGNPASYFFASQGTRHVVHLGWSPTGTGANNGLVEWFSGSDGQWGATGLMIDSDAPPARTNPTAYIFTHEKTQHVLYEATTDFGHIQEFWWNDDGWHWDDLTAQHGFPLASSLVQGYDFEPQTQSNQHIVFGGVDSHVHELASSGGSWNHYDLSEQTGAPPAVAEPCGYAFDAQGTQHVVYRGYNGAIHELWWDASGWHHEPLTEQTGAPPAGGEPFGYVFGSQGTQHVLFRGETGRVHELWWDSTGWHLEDLTAHTGAPLVNGLSGVKAYAFEASPGVPEATQHVLFRGVDDHVHELWWDHTGWHHNDLNGVPGLPLAAGDPTGFADLSTGTQHVFFVTADHHLIALRWSA